MIPSSKQRNPYLTNVRKTDSRYWRSSLRHAGNRCLVPVTSFAEPDIRQGGRYIWTLFAQDESRPVMFFAGIWREWEGDRGTKAAPDVVKHLVFSFLTTEVGADAKEIHPDANPVLLLDEGAREIRLNAPEDMALSPLRPSPVGALKIFAFDTKQDSGP